MKLYFVRHGESEANRLQVISNRDVPHHLTVTGRLQAAALAERLRGQPLTRIYTSPIPRARETAEILSLELNVPLEIADALREPDCGILEGYGDEATWAQIQYWKDTWLAGRERDRGPVEGETFNAVRERFIVFIDGLVAQYGNTEHEFVLVAHGALLLYGLPSVLANVDHQFILEHGIDYAGLVATEYRAGKFVCLAWGTDEKLVGKE
jgi:broad specificity phosphatase PhoE